MLGPLAAPGTVALVSLQCSPWPDAAYQVNSTPSPSYNGSPNSFSLGEGYVILCSLLHAVRTLVLLPALSPFLWVSQQLSELC